MPLFYDIFMELDEIKSHINNKKDISYAKFFAKLCPGVENIAGIRVPYIRKLAKEIVKGDVINFLNSYNILYHEEFILQGIVIAYSKMPLEKKLYYLKMYAPKIYDWSACDVVVSSFKFKEKELPTVYDFIMQYRYSKNEYETRFLIIMLLDYFIRDEYLDNIKDILETEVFDKYYSQMATSWLISVMFVKYRDYTLNYLNNNTLDNWTYNKALQKIIESNRVSKEDKLLIKTMKRK